MPDRYEPKYWNGNGEFSELIKKATAEPVPLSGEAPTLIGEIVRSFNRVYYDIFNNGGGNLAENWEKDSPRPTELTATAKSWFKLLSMVNPKLSDKLRDALVEYLDWLNIAGPGKEKDILHETADAMGDEVGRYLLKNGWKRTEPAESVRLSFPDHHVRSIETIPGTGTTIELIPSTGWGGPVDVLLKAAFELAGVDEETASNIKEVIYAAEPNVKFVKA